MNDIYFVHKSVMGYKMKPGSYPEKPKNSENEFFGNGWSVKRENEKFYFNFISGSLQGEFKSIEIAEEDYNSARAGEISFDEICAKYNVS